jgi:CheY-like chemotaxis protein
MSTAIRILLAEDNPGDVELVREALREYQVECQLHVAQDGAEARRYIERLGKSDDAPCPDLLLLDLNLPKAHGYELFQLFRAHALCAQTPVIVMTSSSAPKDRERAAALGAARYFCKPCELAEFLKLGSVIRTVAQERGLVLA